MNLLDPRYAISLNGFDRRGAVAAVHSATAGGFTVSGAWSDQADFAVLYLLNADDLYGHLFTSRYLPNFDLAYVTLDFDLAITGCMNPASAKFPSVPWNALSYITSGEVAGSVFLPAPTTTTGAVAASCSFTVAGTPTTFDRVQLVYLGNVLADLSTITTGQSLTTVAANLAALVNALTSSTVPIAATSSGAVVTVSCTVAGRDGNSIELLSMWKTSGNTKLYPTSSSSTLSGQTGKLIGGVDPTSMHFHLDFSALGLASCRQIWLTLAPWLTYDAGTVNPSLVAFAPVEFSAVFSNWTVVDSGSVTPLKIAGPGSVTIGNRDAWAQYSGSGWTQEVGAYFEGFAWQSANAGDSVAVAYSCQLVHDLYLGTAISSTGGVFSASLDGGAAVSVSGYADALSPFAGRRLIASGVAAGLHVVILTVASGACLFDFVQAAVLSDPVAPSVSYPSVNCACDYDTDQTYKIPPVRALWILSQMGFAGDIDFYAGVFFALKRVRNGGHFHQATVTIAGPLGTGTGFGDGDSYFFDISTTALGAAAYPADTVTTLAQRLVDAVNATFVGVWAAPTSTAGQFTVSSLSPINGFTMAVSAGAGTTGSIVMTGDIGVGNEGTWAVDASQSSPINRGFADYLADFAGLVQAAGQTMTVAFSQELLAPPDANTSAGAWIQRFPDGSTVLTDTGFGSWGAGVVEAVVLGVYQETGHGYITGNAAGFASSTASGIWLVVVVDANHYTLGTEIANSGGYTPGVGDSVLIGLQTSQCTFNAATVTAYLAYCYVQAANILATAGLVPWLQFGEILWWFFSRVESLAVGYASATSPISIGTNAVHTLSAGNRVIDAGIQGIEGANGDWPITVTDSTHFTLTGSTGVGSYMAGTGTVSGGGMAYYDAWAVLASSTALGRAMANFQHQDDDPTVNSGADAAWLAGAIKTHIDTIRTAVLAAQSGAKFELLFPCDVNAGICYYTDDVPYPQGGKLNAAVNFPPAYQAQSGSGLDRLKIEALSWSETYRNLDQAKAALAFATTSPCSWALAHLAYLVAIDNGGCPYEAEYLAALATGIPLLNLWAADHMNLFDRPVPLPGARTFAVVE